MDLEHTLRKYKVAARNKNEAHKHDEISEPRSAITASYRGFTGATLHKGKALSLEIESYRRRIQALVHFFELVAPHWWDRLHPFNGEFVRRPSRSADLIRKTQCRLSRKLAKLTPRTVLPAAAAIASIEERDTIQVLPKSLYRTSPSREKNARIFNEMENGDDLVNLALSIARRLGEIEKAKQQIILYAYDWINADGRDFNLRNRRINILVKNAQACIIERFRGVRALITHYYRRRASTVVATFGNLERTESFSDPKFQLQHAFDGITAIYLNSTNPAIIEMISRADSRPTGGVTTGVAILTDINSEEMIDVVNKGVPFDKYSSNEALLLTASTDTQEKSDSGTTFQNVNPFVEEFANQKDFNLDPISPIINEFDEKINVVDLNSRKMRKKRIDTEEQDMREYFSDDNEEIIIVDAEKAANIGRFPSLMKKRQNFEDRKLQRQKIRDYYAISVRNLGNNKNEDKTNAAIRGNKRETLAVIASSDSSKQSKPRRGLFETVVDLTSGPQDGKTYSKSSTMRKSSLVKKSLSGSQDSRMRSHGSNRSFERLTGNKVLHRASSKQPSLSKILDKMNSSELIMADFRKLILQNKRQSIH